MLTPPPPPHLTAVLWGSPNENVIHLPGSPPSTQTCCLPRVQERSEAGSNGESFCGENREKGFSFESILLLFCLRRRAERNECSVFMGPNTKHHVHTRLCWHTHTHARPRRDWQQHINEMKKVKKKKKKRKINTSGWMWGGDFFQKGGRRGLGWLPAISDWISVRVGKKKKKHEK